MPRRDEDDFLPERFNPWMCGALILFGSLMLWSQFLQCLSWAPVVAGWWGK